MLRGWQEAATGSLRAVCRWLGYENGCEGEECFLDSVIAKIQSGSNVGDLLSILERGPFTFYSIRFHDPNRAPAFVVLSHNSMFQKSLQSGCRILSAYWSSLHICNFLSDGTSPSTSGPPYAARVSQSKTFIHMHRIRSSRLPRHTINSTCFVTFCCVALTLPMHC